MTAAAAPYQFFAALPAKEYAALKADIARKGVLVPVELDEDGNVLDGHHRVRAWTKLRAEGVHVSDYPTIVRAGLDEDGKHEHVLTLNLKRRHLGPVAWATAFTRLAVLRGVRLDKQGRQKAKTDTMAFLAREAGVSPRTARRRLRMAKELEKHPDLAEQVNAGELDPQRAVRDARDRARRQRREQLGAEIAATPVADLDTIGTYGVIYADPPWRLDGNGSNRAIENHYPTMPIDDICARRPPAADDAVLFLWTISPLVPEALRVLDAWGFTYRTNMVWVKDKVGMGYYARQQHETLFIAKRGKLPTPPEADRPPSVIGAPRGAHSAKPTIIYEIIERMYPDVPRLEMFCRARQRRPGWAAWGYEAPVDEEADGSA